jgi:hypothetical protein
VNREPDLKKKLFSDVVIADSPSISFVFSLILKDSARALSFIPLVIIDPIIRKEIRENCTAEILFRWVNSSRCFTTSDPSRKIIKPVIANLNILFKFNGFYGA